jgi:parvulin-like peptidyl-prolyl isomerase
MLEGNGRRLTMDRRLIAGTLGLLISGCALSRSEMPAGIERPTGPNAPVGLTESLPALNQSINRAGVPTDPASRRTSQRPVTPVPPPAALEPAQPDGPPAMPDSRPVPASPPEISSPQPPVLPRLAPPPALSQVPSTAPTAADGPTPQGPQPPILPAEEPPKLPPTVVAEAPRTLDPAVQTASASIPAEPVGEIRDGAASNGEAATVGHEVITIHQVTDAMKERVAKIPAEEWKKPEVKQIVFKGTLENLIQQSLLCQAARKKIKDMKSFNEAMDKKWAETELQPMLREYKVQNVPQLKAELVAQGRSLDQIRESYRQYSLAQSYIYNQVRHKLEITLPEKYKYYNDHLSNFDRPAQVVWREIEIDIARCADRAEARRKAEAILARLQKGEDWGKIARAESHGATAREGGRWETAPNSHALPDINEPLNNLPEGRFTKVIEVPGAFHIIGVESRRPAGPARFDEVQEQIHKTMLEAKMQALVQAEVELLRSKTVVTSVLDQPKTDPAAIRTGGTR